MQEMCTEQHSISSMMLNHKTIQMPRKPIYYRFYLVNCRNRRNPIKRHQRIRKHHHHRPRQQHQQPHRNKIVIVVIIHHDPQLMKMAMWNLIVIEFILCVGVIFSHSFIICSNSLIIYFELVVHQKSCLD